MSLDPRAAVSWGMFPDSLPANKAPFAATWGLRGSLSGGSGGSLIERFKIYVDVMAMWMGFATKRSY